MSHRIDIDRAQGILHYTFRDSLWLSRALQAAEKIQDPDTGDVLSCNDGNRRLAQLGHKVTEMVLIDMWFGAGSDRGNTHTVIEKLANREFLAQVARRTGLDNCIRCSERQAATGPSPQTLRLVIAAVIGAVWRDSDRNFDRIVSILETLGIIDVEMA